mmetsp:Transcript_12885/g.27821  ORF Transcript_12885/g.27821 Transcript_12885/m.27821 type:complete len:204 (-) Transcript_12885:448-1059(-)
MHMQMQADASLCICSAATAKSHPERCILPTRCAADLRPATIFSDLCAGLGLRARHEHNARQQSSCTMQHTSLCMVHREHGAYLQVWVVQQPFIIQLLRLHHQLPQGAPVLVLLVQHPVVEQIHTCQVPLPGVLTAEQLAADHVRQAVLGKCIRIKGAASHERQQQCQPAVQDDIPPQQGGRLAACAGTCCCLRRPLCRCSNDH